MLVLISGPNSSGKSLFAEGLISRADYLIELGPGAGKDGGRIVYEGPPCPDAPILHAATAHLS